MDLPANLRRDQAIDRRFTRCLSMSETLINTPAQRLWLGSCAALLVGCCPPPPVVRAPPRPQPQCERVLPVRLIVGPRTLATKETPEELTLPTSIVESISRAGIGDLLYIVTICGGAPPVISAIERSTGLAELDRFLDARIRDLHLDLPSSECTTAKLLLANVNLACQAPKGPV